MPLLADIFSAANALRRNTKDIVQNPLAVLERQVDALRNTQQGLEPVANDQGVGLRQLSEAEQNHRMSEAALDTVSMGLGGVIKPLRISLSGPASKGLRFEAQDIQALRDVLQDYTKPRMLAPERAAALVQALRTAEEPGSVAHVLSSAYDEPTALFVTQPGKEMGFDANYLAHLVSLAGQRGTGKQALETARLQGPHEFISTPQSQAYYQKLIKEGFPGLSEHPDKEFGHTRYKLDSE